MIKLRALDSQVLVHNIQKGERTIGGIIILNDDGKEDGIRPRWAQVYSIGKNITEIKVDDWILMDHGRWSRALELYDEETDENLVIWKADYPDGVLAVSETEPTNDSMV